MCIFTEVLCLAEAHFYSFELGSLPLLPNNGLATPFWLASWLLEELVLLDRGDSAGLLHLAVKPSEQVLG